MNVWGTFCFNIMGTFFMVGGGGDILGTFWERKIVGWGVRYVIHIDKKKKWSQNGTLWYTSSEMSYR